MSLSEPTVILQASAREAARSGSSHARWDADVSAKGACIGPMGQRVRAVMHELNEEKIDIIDHDEDPARFVANALSPAKVSSVTVVDEARALRMGRDGRQNVGVFDQRQCRWRGHVGHDDALRGARVNLRAPDVRRAEPAPRHLLPDHLEGREGIGPRAPCAPDRLA